MSEAPRKIAVIVALDVAGYSARTEADEARATAEVAGLRGVIEGIATRHAGRVFNTAGDGFMLEFGSSLAALEAALALAETCEPKVRVGVHLGDVVVQPNGDLLGHGVNVAARLMAKSDPGGALVSAAVRQTIRGPIAQRLVSRGLMQLDKMAETIEAFSLSAAGHTTAVVSSSAKDGEPVLAVLPFDNLSNDPEMQFFSDGISEEIIQVLMSGGHLKLIGRTSAFHFRGPLKAEAARTLKATHVLDGSVRKAGTRIRVSAQLTEASDGAGLWAHRYDEDLSDIFALQDDIATKVSAALKLVLAPVRRTGPIDPATYEMYLRATKLTWAITDDDARRAVELLERVVAQAPEFAPGWGLLANARGILLSRDEDSIGTPAHSAALQAAERMLALDPNAPLGYRMRAVLKPAFAEHGEKIRLLEQAQRLEANNPGSFTTLGGAYMSVGRVSDACECMLRAYELEPMLPFISSLTASVLIATGRTAEGLRISDEAKARQPNSLWLTVIHIFNLYFAGRVAEANDYFKHVLEARTEIPADLLNHPRLLLQLPNLDSDQRATLLRALMNPEHDRVLRIPLCGLAAENGLADLAVEQLVAALRSGRPIGGLRTTQIGVNRSFVGAAFFAPASRALRADARFPQVCARLGLVDYWSTSGHWPDCADEVPYHFKAECEKATAELAKA